MAVEFLMPELVCDLLRLELRFVGKKVLEVEKPAL